MTNRLANETSPYLLQHQDNPVDWYAWGDEAFATARAEDKPVLLSIGYSACHWCHVMAHESFEDPQIASLMNELFVNVKVDREERPDVDSVYMAAVQAMTGHGGWPMTVFLAPDGRPFYGGTYFPNDDRGGMPAFPRVLQAVADAYHNRKSEVLSNSSAVMGAIEAQSAPRKNATPLDRAVIDNAAEHLAEQFDAEHGGFGIQPKFPQPMNYELLLRHWHATGDRRSLDMVTLTLEQMARGGIYDQLGGGFARYSTDTFWLVPHFEKMLYDNALLMPLYLHAWQATGNPLLVRVIEETFSYVLREMTHRSGGFYSSQDADSEGEEGKFFVWLPEEIDRVLGLELGKVARTFWGVTREGNFEGRNILSVPKDMTEVAGELGMSETELESSIAAARKQLYAARAERVWPGRDEKVLAAWNALMLKAFAECGAAMDRREWVDVARRNAEFLVGQMVSPSGRLLRTWKDDDGGGQARLNGYLEDYAMLADALISLYEATFERRWLDEARRWAGEMIRLFWSEDDGVFYDTGIDHEEMIVRPRDVFDNAMPCGGSAAAMALLRLSVHTGEPEHARRAVKSLGSVREFMDRSPGGFGHWMCALDLHVSGAQEIAVVGPRGEAATESMLATARSGYAPNRVLAWADEEQSPDAPPLLASKGLINGKPAAYVCRNYVCDEPVTDAESLRERLTSSAGRG